MSADLAVIKDKLRKIDVLSGLTGSAPQADLAALCEEIAFNDVADLVAEVEQLNLLVRNNQQRREEVETNHGRLLRETERLRRMLWAHHGHDGLYGDDGEMQCNMHGSIVDFKRDSLDRVEFHLKTHPSI